MTADFIQTEKCFILISRIFVSEQTGGFNCQSAHRNNMNWILWILLTLFILSLISTTIVAFRYRRQIQTGWLMWSTFRKMKKQTAPKQKNIEKTGNSQNSPLVRCSKCEKWIPQDDAVKLKSNFYCSHRCLEESFTAAKSSA